MSKIRMNTELRNKILNRYRESAESENTQELESYRIEKHTDNLDEANKFLSALSLLESDEYVSFFISSHEFKEPLILDKEVA